MIIYYIIVLLFNIILVSTFREKIILSGAGTIVTMIIIMIFLAYYYNQNREEHSLSLNERAYSSDITEKELFSIAKYTSLSYKIYIPLCIPFIFFFSIWVKIAVVIIMYLLAFLTGAIIFRIKCGKAVKKRIENEHNELEAQIQKESEGKLK